MFQGAAVASIWPGERSVSAGASRPPTDGPLCVPAAC